MTGHADLMTYHLEPLDPDNQQAEGVVNDPAFHAYRGFDARWRRELLQIARMADDEGDARFCYTGMAQTYLLDRLSPGWKQVALQPGMYVDDLLAGAISHLP